MQPAFLVGVVIAAIVAVALASILALQRRSARQGAALELLRDAKSALERQLAIEQERNQRLTELQQALAESRAEARTLGDGKGDAEARLAAAVATSEERARALEGVRAELARAHEALARAQTSVEELGVVRARLEEMLANEREQSAEKIKLLEEARERMSAEFRLLADGVMQRHSESFSRQNKEQIEAVLSPLREKIAEFQQGLQQARTEGAGIRAALEQQVKSLAAAAAHTSEEAQNLTKALKGQVRMQGAWGEMVLQTILERSGLRSGEEFLVQETFSTENGQRLRPDVVLQMPNGRRIFIDAKVSLTAYAAHISADSEQERRIHLERHVASIRTHIGELSSKQYQSLHPGGLGFVVMFVPIEAALAAALTADPMLTTLAAESHVAIATPTTLIMALRTVEHVWQIERQNRNVAEIFGKAGQIYDKLADFVKDMQMLGRGLDSARNCYEAAIKKLADGRGNLLRQVEGLKQLGAQPRKSLPLELLDGTAEKAPEPQLIEIGCAEDGRAPA